MKRKPTRTPPRSPVSSQDALAYHSDLPRGKIEVVPTKPLSSQYDLSLAYSPGVAAPCREIASSPDRAFDYTAKGNLVGVISNGTAVLGLGSIGPYASKPVMEGKAVLFKRFAGIDVFDLELDVTEVDRFVDTVAALEPTFGGINLEDIAAPQCFEIERKLIERCSIPVMHDDQHGTAIICGAALLNALRIADKRIEEIRVVVLGAGAAAVATARFFLSLGVNPKLISMFDKDGVVSSARADLSTEHGRFAVKDPSLGFDEALEGADVLLGLSVGNIVTAQQIQLMAERPVVFALANPEPEIDYETARNARSDLIIATGRSDHPNQVNNVLGFPYIFRGALDVNAHVINEEMKRAAAKALARLAREPVPETVGRAYSDHDLTFGSEYLIPKPLDPRLLTTIAPAVARAAIESGVARNEIEDWEGYEAELLERVGVGQKLVTGIVARARRAQKRVIFAEADAYNILKAAEVCVEQGLAEPILLGSKRTIRKMIEEHEIRGLDESSIIDPTREERLCRDYGRRLYEKRQRKGVTYDDAVRLMHDRNYFGTVMLELGLGDALISGLTKEYPKIVRPALQVIGPEESIRKVAGMYIVNSARGVFFLADTTVNLDPTAEELVDIIGLTARTVRFFDIEPVVAVLSFSNFGSTRAAEAEKCKRAVEKSREAFPELIIDGEVQANIALNQHLLSENYPFSDLVGRRVNTLIFPNLSSGNIAYKLLSEIGGAEIIGPVLMGMRKPVHILQLGSSVREIVNMVALAVVKADTRSD